MWWEYNQNTIVLAGFLRQKNGGRGHFQELIYDSSDWKRICRIHSYYHSRVKERQCSLQWSRNENGQFSLKSAYDEFRVSRASLRSCRYIWWARLPQSSKVFMWKLLFQVLPLPDIMWSFSVVFPMICPFCSQPDGDSTHIFLHCHALAHIWRKYALLLEGPFSLQSSLNSHLISWWLASSASTMKGNLRVVVTHAACQSVWEEYMVVVFGDDVFVPQRLEEYTDGYFHLVPGCFGQKVCLSDTLVGGGRSIASYTLQKK